MNAVGEGIGGSEWGKKEVLERTAKEYFSSAREEFAKERYNSSVVLFFKAHLLTSMCCKILARRLLRIIQGLK